MSWRLSGKPKSSQLASQVMKPRSRFLLTAQSAERKEASFTIQLLNSIITQGCNKKANEDPALSCAKFALVDEPSTASSHNDNICGRLPVQHYNRSEHSSDETKAHYSAGPELEINVQRLVPDDHFGGWLRTPSMKHNTHFNYVPTAKSKFRNEWNPIVLQAILVGDLHAL